MSCIFKMWFILLPVSAVIIGIHVSVIELLCSLHLIILPYILMHINSKYCKKNNNNNIKTTTTCLVHLSSSDDPVQLTGCLSPIQPNLVQFKLTLIVDCGIWLLDLCCTIQTKNKKDGLIEMSITSVSSELIVSSFMLSLVYQYCLSPKESKTDGIIKMSVTSACF